MERYILDTNLFFNMEADLGFGDTTEGIIRMMTQTVREAKKQEKLEIFMPPRIVEEVQSFFEDPHQPFLVDFFSVVTVKSPSLSEMNISTALVAELIEDTRQRNYRGLRVGEEEIANAGELFMGKEALPKKEFQMTIGKVVSKYRERFRNATRTGCLDSLADFELILLAKECQGFLITTDAGVTSWGRKMGVFEMSPSVFGKKLQEYL